ncbi:hypothetical protein CLV62_10195 [Dysgonomonas alginatilytica]|uniref:Uncharacterized protein n=1 Tax=Dysgonomonas alginatilytica TaxID=1605892 RepID=A0A2V3PVI5_9BACT|nr:hypothetical protein CLV62_10195 [Dysgonomonas alginatilytica]
MKSLILCDYFSQMSTNRQEKVFSDILLIYNKPISVVFTKVIKGLKS